MHYFPIVYHVCICQVSPLWLSCGDIYGRTLKNLTFNLPITKKLTNGILVPPPVVQDCIINQQQTSLVAIDQKAITSANGIVDLALNDTHVGVQYHFIQWAREILHGLNLCDLKRKTIHKCAHATFTLSSRSWLDAGMTRKQLDNSGPIRSTIMYAYDSGGTLS